MLAIYTRLSREDEESNSIENQLKEGKEFAQKHKLSFRHYDEGMGISGRAAIENRPQFDKLLQDVKNGEITKIWVRHQNRIERSGVTFHIFADIIKRYNVEIWYGDSKSNYNDAGDYFHSSIISAVNAYHANLASQQIKKAVALKAKEGKAVGNVPFGYLKDENDKVVPHPDNSKIVRQIFSDYLKRIGSNSICEWLNDQKVPTLSKNTKQWTPSTVRYILKNRAYIGERKFRNTHYPIEPIISLTDFNKVQNILNERGVFIRGRANRDYLLSSLVKCGVCGENFHGRKHSTKHKDKEYVYYRCNSKKYRGKSCGNKAIMQNQLEDFIWNMVVLHGDLGTRVEKSLSDTSNKKDLENNIVKAEKDLNALTNEWKNIRRQAAKGILDDDDLQEEKNRIDRERTKIERDLAHDFEELSKIQNAINAINYDPTVVSKNEKSRLFQELIKTVTVTYKNDFYHIDIDYNLPIDSDSYKMEKDYTGAWMGDFLVGWVGSNLHPAREKRALERIRKHLKNEKEKRKLRLEKFHEKEEEFWANLDKR